ncbi:hypothetical protein QP185_16895 [Sphingomonas aerolata]|uniref:hypothetical protein n=1 Tax=Sphingomonas aerolata TaxID=185951 RepID=UPI002FE33E13
MILSAAGSSSTMPNSLAADMDAMQVKLDRYWACVRAIEDDIDPCRRDPAPRHGDHTGASLAILALLYRAAGGVPAIPAGEDRALVEAAVAAGGRLGHPMSVWTRVSARTIGRATGGMADHMQALSDRGGARRAHFSAVVRSVARTRGVATDAARPARW